MYDPTATGSLSYGAVKILTAAQIRQADNYTIFNEPISSIDLMERAAMHAFGEIEKHIGKNNSVDVACGPGNNGGDGLVIARLLVEKGYKVQAFLFGEPGKLSDDCQSNMQRFADRNASLLKIIKEESEFEGFQGEIIIDALFGTGISRTIEGSWAKAIGEINNSGALVISIDLPSGLYTDDPTPAGAAIVQADLTITFQAPKLCFFFAMNEKYTGEWKVVDIGLDKEFLNRLESKKYFVTGEQVAHWITPRAKFSHKGNFGHAWLVAGSQGMMGAALLAAGACLRTGAGLLTVHVPRSGVPILQSALPEALIHADNNENFFSGLEEKEMEKTTALAAGPGLSTDLMTQKGIRQILGIRKPILLDADALNILALHKEWLENLPAGTILTPHQKEFERLTGKYQDDFERHSAQMDFSAKHQVITVLKGAFSCTTMPDGNCFFNSTGNPAMATAGSGDVLTGVILGLLAQNFSPGKAAVAGVYLHGLAGDLAALESGSIGLLASDIIRNIPHAIEKLLDGKE